MSDPALSAVLRAALLEVSRRSAEAAELNLYTFFKDVAWPIMEPRRPFVPNWHLEAISEHLEAVTRGQLKRLLINVPFRTAKSSLVSVAWPAWVWLQDPDRLPGAGPGHQWLCGSYAEKLAIRDSLKMRRLVTAPVYQAAWGSRFRLTGDQNQKVRFQNDKNGYRIAFGMTGGVMGDGGDTIIIDDPHDRQGAHSDAERENALTTYDEALVTRLNDPESSAIVMIMQRLHKDDLSGHVLKEGGWTHLMLPMRYERSRACSTVLGFKDPRTAEGELMWPARFPEKTVANLEHVLGDYGAAGQLQQRPSPAGGGILRSEKFQLWPAHKPLPDLHFIIQSYDTAFTDQTQNDPTACTVWGLFYLGVKQHEDDPDPKRCLLLLDAWSAFMKYPELRKKLMDDWKAEYGGIKDDVLHPARRADVVIIEEKGSGISVIQELQRANVPVHAYNPGRASKVARAQVASAVVDAEVLYVIESKRDPGKPVTWARELLSQCEDFPNGEHDDLVDTLTQTVIYANHADLTPLSAVPAEDPLEVDYHERNSARRRNPYS